VSTDVDVRPVGGDRDRHDRDFWTMIIPMRVKGVLMLPDFARCKL
jgi:hypothetical protein